MEIGEKIKQLRKDKKISQKELADLLGIKPPSVAYFEGRGNTITIETALKIATALGVSVKSLLFDDIDYTDVPNSKEVENLLIAKDKENEDLRKENESLSKEIGLLRKEVELFQTEKKLKNFSNTLSEILPFLELISTLATVADEKKKSQLTEVIENIESESKQVFNKK